MRKKTVVLAATPSASPAGVVIGDPVGSVIWARGIVLDATLTGNTGGTLDVYIQREISGGVWRDWVHFAQLAAGANPAYYTVDCERAAESAVTAVGTGTAVAATVGLAAGDIACPLPHGRMRLVLVSGASTSASFAQTIYVTAQFDHA